MSLDDDRDTTGWVGGGGETKLGPTCFVYSLLP